MNTSTYRDYRPETEALLMRLIDAGFTLRACSNGDGKIPFTTLSEFIEEVMGADEAHVYVTSPEGVKGTLFLVYGNEPGVLVANCSDDPLLNAVTDAHADAWDGRDQPMTTR